MNLVSLTVIVSLIILFLLVIKYPLKSIQLTGSILVRFVIGGFLIFAVNIVGTQFGFHLPLNLYTAGISGLLGIPGVAAIGVISIMYIN